MERLTFNPGSVRQQGPLVVAGRSSQAQRSIGTSAPKGAGAKAREHYDWDYVWMISFTALLFFRPQDQIPPLEPFHLAELTAIAGLAAMAVRRLRAGLTVAKINTEVIGVMALGAVIVFTVPFSFCPGGSAHVFS